MPNASMMMTVRDKIARTAILERLRGCSALYAWYEAVLAGGRTCTRATELPCSECVLMGMRFVDNFSTDGSTGDIRGLILGMSSLSSRVYEKYGVSEACGAGVVVVGGTDRCIPTDSACTLASMRSFSALCARSASRSTYHRLPTCRLKIALFRAN